MNQNLIREIMYSDKRNLETKEIYMLMFIMCLVVWSIYEIVITMLQRIAEDEREESEESKRFSEYVERHLQK